MSPFPSACPAAVLAAALSVLLSPVAQSGVFAGMPDAIVCSVKDPTGILPWDRLVFYASAHMREGDTLYKSSTSDPVVLLVSSEGIVDGANLADCDGRSVDSLREEGRAFSFTVSVPDHARGAR